MPPLTSAAESAPVYFTSVVFELQLSSSQLGRHTHSKEDMPLRKRGDNMGFIDLDQMRNSLPGDPSDSDPGYEVTN